MAPAWAAPSSTRASSWAEHKALQAPERTRHQLSRGGLYRGLRPGRLYRPRPRGAAAQHRRGDLAVQFLPDPAGASRRWRCGWIASSRTRSRSPASCASIPGRVGQLRRPAGSPRPCVGAEVPGRQGAGPVHLRREGRPRGRRALPGRAAAVHPPGQHRRRQVAGHAPGVHHAPPAQSRRAAKAGVREKPCACRSASNTSTT